MAELKREILSGWGHFPVQECLCWRPEKRRDLKAALQHAPHLVARGLGRSYGDAAIEPEGTLLTTRLDHIIEFNAEAGTVRAQAGVTLAELMELSIPRGWLPPVIPGTRHVTLGGAFASNVHGKNHWKDGEFAEHVQSVRLLLADGSFLECSPDQHGELFWATAGGMGMTGIIEELTLKLKPLPSASLRKTTYRVDSIEDMVAAFEHQRGSADYLIGWIDHMGKDEHLGRGVFEAASHVSVADGGAELKRFRPPRSWLSVPFFFPSFVLNRYSMALHNKLRFLRFSRQPKTRTARLGGFFHPLDAINHWNRLYGRQGFFQYQCLIPETPDVSEKLRALLTLIQERKCFSYLAVLKYHRDGRGLLTFSRRGYSLALDLPNTARVRELLPELDQWVADHGGRVYLAKDALLSPPLFNRMYGDAAKEWLELIRDIDMAGKFTSLMSRRLEWKR